MRLNHWLSSLLRPSRFNRRRPRRNRWGASAGRLAVEALEERALLAGDVTVALGIDNLEITGDSESNQLSIEIDNDSIVAIGAQGTTINGSADPFVVQNLAAQLPGGLVASLGAGDDQLTISGIAILDSVRISTGLGADQVVIDSVTLNNPQATLSVATAAGNDKVAVAGTTASSVSVFTSQGNDLVELGVNTVSGDLDVYAGLGDDVVGVNGGTIGGDATISPWYGSDEVLVQNLTIDGDLDAIARGVRDGQAQDNPLVDDPNLWDIDGSGDVSIFTDGILTARYLSLFTGSALVDGAIGANATRTDAAEITSYLDDLFAKVDPDPSNPNDLFEEGIGIIRQLAGFGTSEAATGQNTLVLKQATVNGDTWLHTRSGVDVISIEQSTLDGDVEADTGSGDDAVTLRESTLDNDLRINTAGGNDFVLFDQGTFNDTVHVGTGANDDHVAVLAGSKFDDMIRLDGGPNQDAADLAAGITTSDTPVVVNFESTSIDADDLDQQTMAAQARVDQLAQHLAPEIVADTFQINSRRNFVSSGSVLDNDTGLDLKAVANVIESEQGAMVAIDSDGRVTYAAQTSNALSQAEFGDVITDRFQYEVTDGTGQTYTGDVEVTFTAPLADHYGYGTDEDTVLNVAADVGLLANNTARGENPLPTITAFDATSTRGATVNVNADGSFSYDGTGVAEFQALTLGESLYDEFTYTLNGTHMGYVGIQVLGAIDAPDDEYQWQLPDVDDPAFTVDAAGGVLANDPGSNLTVVGFDAESLTGARVVVNADGSFTYDQLPASNELDGAGPGEDAGTDWFEYIASDGTTQSTHRAYIHRLGVNDAPAAADDAFAINQDGEFASTTSVLDNDYDPDRGDTFTITTFDPVSTEGAISTVNDDGTFTYDPSTLTQLAPGAMLADTFTYTITDASGKSATGTVTVTVTGINHPVVAQDDTYFLAEENQDFVVDGVIGLLANDDAGDTEDSLEVYDYTPDTELGGVVVVNKDGTFVYSPQFSKDIDQLRLGQNLVDTFQYTAIDEHGTRDTKTASIEVWGGIDPGEDRYVLSLDGANLVDEPVTNIPADQGVLVNDPLVNPIVRAEQVTSDFGATVQINADGSFTYDPSTVDDNNLLSSLANPIAPDVVYDHFQYTAKSDDGVGFGTSTEDVDPDTIDTHVEITLTVNIQINLAAPHINDPVPASNPVSAQITNRELVITANPTGGDARDVTHIMLQPASPDEILISTSVRTGDIVEHSFGHANSRPLATFANLGPFDQADFDSIRFDGSSGNELFDNQAREQLSNVPMILNGMDGDDHLIGGDANDVIRGGAGFDRLIGFAGDDQLFGEGDRDFQQGGLGDDLLDAGDDQDPDLLIGGGGTNTMVVALYDINFDKTRALSNIELGVVENTPAPPASAVAAPDTPQFVGPLTAGGVLSSHNQTTLFEDEIDTDGKVDKRGTVDLNARNFSGQKSVNIYGNGLLTVHLAQHKRQSISTNTVFSFQANLYNTSAKQMIFRIDAIGAGGWRTVYWGDNAHNLGNATRLGDLPTEAGKWFPFQVTASQIGITGNGQLGSWGFQVYGDIYFDQLIVSDGAPSGGGPAGRSGRTTLLDENMPTSGSYGSQPLTNSSVANKGKYYYAQRFTSDRTRKWRNIDFQSDEIVMPGDQLFLHARLLAGGNNDINVYVNNHRESFKISASWTRVKIPLTNVGKAVGVVRVAFISPRYDGVIIDNVYLESSTPPHSSGTNGTASIVLNNNPTDLELGEDGKLMVHRNLDGSVVTISGPSRIGFSFVGSPGAFSKEGGSAEEFVARSTVNLVTALGNLPIPATSALPLRIKTKSDNNNNVGEFDDVAISALDLSSNIGNNPINNFVNSELGLSTRFGGFSREWGLALGKDLENTLSLPLAKAVPYLWFKKQTGGDLVEHGNVKIGTAQKFELQVAFDPSDPALLIKIQDYAVGGSKKGRIPFIPNTSVLRDASGARYDADAGTKQSLFYGNLYAEGKVPLDKFQASLEGAFVIDVDGNNDGNALGLSGTEFRRIVDGSTRLEQAVGNAISDLKIGVNGKANIEIGSASTQTGLTLLVGQATAYWDGDSFGIRGQTEDPFKSTVLRDLNLVSNPQLSGDIYIDTNGSYRIEVSGTRPIKLYAGLIELTEYKVTVAGDSNRFRGDVNVKARSPVAPGTISIDGFVDTAHPSYGNRPTWQLRALVHSQIDLKIAKFSGRFWFWLGNLDDYNGGQRHDHIVFQTTFEGGARIGWSNVLGIEVNPDMYFRYENGRVSGRIIIKGRFHYPGHNQAFSPLTLYFSTPRISFTIDFPSPLPDKSFSWNL